MSSDDKLDFSRRKLLGSVATLGAAGAIGGTGTIAYFSDEEEFANNQLTAGSFDLKVDWQEYYSDWSADEESVVSDIIMTEPDTTLQEGEYPSDYTGLPTPNNALIAIPDEDVQAFLDAAALEAYPDSTDTGLVDSADELESLGYDVCVHGADTPEDLDPTVEPSTLDPTVDDSFKTEGTGLRTNNADTVTEGEPNPLINISDVKPGDFGELTISAHLCDNDGYLALVGGLESASENGTTEPERKDPDEDAPDGDTVELLEQARVSIWLDGVDTNDRGIDQDPTDVNGNNLIDDGETVLVEEATLGTALDILEGTGISLSPSGSGATGTASFACLENGISISEPGTSGIQDGQTGTITGSSGDTTIEIDRVEDEDEDGEIESFSFTLSGPDDLAVGDYPGVCSLTINTESGNSIEVDYGSGGCVRDSILLPTPDQPQVDSRITSVDFDLCTLVAPGDLGEELECFNGSDTYYVGFAWWLPVDHGNEVQTDSVSFDLGFYAEQCRHNDGIGNVPN
jgi:predicted ribosomally synthesized peptide with SipW-like signal peptide